MSYKNIAHYIVYSNNHELKETLDKARKEVVKSEYPFYHRVIKGCSENKIYIDTLIRHYVKKSGKLLDIEYAYFVLSIYLILFTNKKKYAIVNSVVNDIKKKRKFMAPVFNGVLRNIIRDSENNFKEVFKSFSEKKKIAIRHSINEELLELLLDDYSTDDIDKMFDEFDNIRTYAFCSDAAKVCESLKSDGIDAEVDNRLSNLIKINSSYGIDKSKAFRNGEIYIQSFSAQAAMSPKEFDSAKKVLDICASPGGKSIAISKRIDGSILALDKSAEKVQRIKDNIQRLGLNNIEVGLNDATKYNAEYKEKFDFIIVDSPCSASGIMSKIPEVKLTRTKEEVMGLVKMQREILDNAYEYLAKGGLLLYITCSILSRENESNMKYILEKTDLKVCTDITNLYYNEGVYKSVPHVSKEEGFFAVVFRK